MERIDGACTAVYSLSSPVRAERICDEQLLRPFGSSSLRSDVARSGLRNPASHAGRRPLTFGMDLVRRVLNLHGSAVGNAAASVRADDAARDARDSADEAVAHATASAARKLSASDPCRGAEP